MTYILNIKSKRRGPGGSAARLALATLLMLGTVVATASAQGHRDDARRDDHRDDHRNWNGGYYTAPPVVYGTPYYAPPPVVYGPSVGIGFPAVVIGIH
jgi:hypothetical protein